MITSIIEGYKLTDEPLIDRIKNGMITREELKLRAKRYWETVCDDLPIIVDGEYGCPICYSKISKQNRLMIEKGYIVCDYCVNFVEGYT